MSTVCAYSLRCCWKKFKRLYVLYMYILKGSKAHLYSIQGCIHKNKCNCECMENWFHSTVCSDLFCSGFSTGVELVGEFSTPITSSPCVWAKPLCCTIQIKKTLFDCNCCIITKSTTSQQNTVLFKADKILHSHRMCAWEKCSVRNHWSGLQSSCWLCLVTPRSATLHTRHTPWYKQLC